MGLLVSLPGVLYTAAAWDEGDGRCSLCQSEITLVNRAHHCRLCGCVCDKRCARINFHMPGVQQHPAQLHTLSERSKRRSLACLRCHALLTEGEATFHRASRVLTDGSTFEVVRGDSALAVVQLNSSLDTVCIVNTSEPARVVALHINDIASVQHLRANDDNDDDDDDDSMTIKIESFLQTGQSEPDVYLLKSADSKTGKKFLAAAQQALAFHKELQSLGVQRE